MTAGCIPLCIYAHIIGISPLDVLNVDADEFPQPRQLTSGSDNALDDESGTSSSDDASSKQPYHSKGPEDDLEPVHRRAPLASVAWCACLQALGCS